MKAEESIASIWLSFGRFHLVAFTILPEQMAMSVFRNLLFYPKKLTFSYPNRSTPKEEHRNILLNPIFLKKKATSEVHVKTPTIS